jgi:hypothetical protein
MKNSKGSTLALALSAMFLFSALGMGAINYSTMQRQSATTQSSSVRAFWLADAGIQASLIKVPTYASSTVYPQTVSSPNTFTTGSFSSSITLPANSPWKITSTGTLSNGTTETLYAKLGYQGLINAISTTGTISQGGNSTVNGTVAQNQSVVTFQSIFGMTLAQAKTLAQSSPNHYYKNPSNNPTVDHLTYVELTGNNKLKITQNNWTGSGLLIVDGGTMEVSGGTFNGIIWVEGGDLSIVSGNPVITGTIYVNGSVSVTSVTGTSTITFDQGIVTSVMQTYGSGQSPKVVCWSEVSTTC